MTHGLFIYSLLLGAMGAIKQVTEGGMGKMGGAATALG